MPGEAVPRTCSAVWSCAQVMLLLAAIPIVLPLLPLFIIGALFISPVAVPLVIAAYALGFMKRPSVPQQMKPAEDVEAYTDIGDQVSPGKSGNVHFRDPDSPENGNGTIEPKRSRPDPGLVTDSLLEETLREARLEVSRESPRREVKEQENEEEPSSDKANPSDETPGQKEEEKGKRVKAEEIFDKTFKALFNFGKDKSPAKSDAKGDDPGTPQK